MVKNFTSIDGLVKKYNEMKYGAGSVSKEFDIPSTTPETSELEPQTEQKTTSEDVEKYITPHSNTIKLPPDLKKVGIKTEEQIKFDDILNKIKLPISDDKIMEDLKAPPSEARRWYATILLYILQRAHMTLKKVGNKVVRAFKTN